MALSDKLNEKIKAKIGLIKKQGLSLNEQEPAPPVQPIMKPIAPLPKPVVEQPKLKPGPKPPFARSKPPIKEVIDVPAKCGHMVKFELFEDKKDKYREQRKAKITVKDCKECKVKAEEEKRRLYLEDQKAKGIDRKKPGWKKRVSENLGRLPHGSKFDIAPFDARNVEWTGTLTIASWVMSPQPPVFSCSDGGLVGLVHELDKQWRAWLEVNQINKFDQLPTTEQPKEELKGEQTNG